MRCQHHSQQLNLLWYKVKSLLIQGLTKYSTTYLTSINDCRKDLYGIGRPSEVQGEWNGNRCYPHNTVQPHSNYSIPSPPLFNSFCVKLERKIRKQRLIFVYYIIKVIPIIDLCPNETFIRELMNKSSFGFT